MFRIVWKSFWANMKNFLAFFISIIMAVNMLFILMYIQEAVRRIEGIETKALEFAYSSEQVKMLSIIIPIILVVTVMVVAYSVRFYIQSRMKDYGMLMMLGIRKKDMQKMIILEYVMSCGLSCIIGLVCGKVCSLLLGRWLEKYTGQSFVNSIRMTNVYRMTGVMCIVLICGVMLAIRVMLEEKGITEAAKTDAVKEKRLTSRKSLVFLAVSMSLILAAFLMAWQNPFSANIAIFVICLSVFFGITFGMGYLLEKYRKSERYCKRILEWDWFYHYFNRNKFRILIQSLIGIVVIYFSFLMLRGTLYERLMPNDFACITQSGSDFAEKFQMEFGGEQKKFPFVWVNEHGGDSRIGMKLSDYNRLFNKQEKLAGDEVINIWREEGTVLLDDKKTEDSLYLGHCTNSEYLGNEKFINNFKVKREEKQELIGFSFCGVVVFADEVVEQAIEQEEFYQEFLLMNVEESKIVNATDFVEHRKEDGILEEAFCRKTIEEIDRKTNMLNLMIVGIVGITVIFFSMFVVWLMMFAELESRKEKYYFLSVCGMQDKERKRVLRKELGHTIWISTIITIALSGSLCGLFIQGYYNEGMFDGRKAVNLLGIILIVYAVIQMMFLVVSRSWMQKRILNE